jgi:hypothetical protein
MVRWRWNGKFLPVGPLFREVTFLGRSAGVARLTP